MFQSPNNRAIVASAPRERSGGAGAIQGTSRLFGQSIGAALVALVFGATGGTHGATIAITIAAGFAAVGVLVSLTRLLRQVRTAPPGPPLAVLRPAARSKPLHEPAE